MAEEFIKKRGAIKRKLTMFTKYVTALKNKLDSNVALTEVEFIELEHRVKLIENLFNEFDKIQFEIEKAATDLDEQYAVRDEFDEDYHKQVAIAKYIQTKNPKLTQRFDVETLPDITQEHVESSSIAGSALVSASVQSQLQSVKLPTIQLPKFDGSYHTWLEFKDTFESLIHKNDAINDIQKFHYLRASLMGEAAQVIKSIEFSSKNYSVAWDILNERYSNTGLLVYNHTKAIFTLESITKESAQKIRKLLDSISKHLRSLNALNQPTENWDTLIIYIITTKLDNVTLREWESQKLKEEVPTFEELKKFLKERADFLEKLESNQADRKGQKYEVGNTKAFVVSQPSCVICEKEHFIHTCESFLKLAVAERLEHVKRAKLCINCLRKGHLQKQCNAGNCRKCGKKHNTLLHFDNSNINEGNNTVVSGISCHVASKQQILLSTVCLKLIDPNGKSHSVRALLDSGSQSSFISKNCCERLKLAVTKQNISIFGVNNTMSQIEGKCQISIQARNQSFKTQIQCFVLPKITSQLPTVGFNKQMLNLPAELELADPNFNVPSKIDILLGADCFWDIIEAKQIKLGAKMPILQETKLGWVISGPIYMQGKARIQCNFSINCELQEQLTRFWQLEECTDKRAWSSEEIECEKHFVQNTTRDAKGRFVVTIPFKESLNKLGNSKDQAEKRFFSLERKLVNNSKLKEMYQNFIREYESLGHMTRVHDKSKSQYDYYLPHHCVVREDSLTTKLRVVFDASARTSSGYSLNDLQMVGPTIQNDLLSILLRFRKHKYVIAADVCKMYRQVLVTPDQRSLQKILWRDNPSEPLIIYNLNTVTYGTAAASFLAIRCLWELGEQYKNENPKIAKIIQQDFYVDDLLTGADNKLEASDICRELATALSRGCFELRKFSSNEPEVLNQISGAESELKVINLGENENTKTLGLNWYPSTDYLLFKINEGDESKVITKRTILSDTAQVFDPLGLLCPCIIKAKIILQKLWLEGISWDEQLPSHIRTEWLEFRHQLPELNQLRLPRSVICNNPIDIQLHIFSDASEYAYGACAYIRSEDANGNVFVQLICAKSKVAPLKSVSIPRLELCGTVIAAKLSDKICKSLDTQFSNSVFWTDSTIVLGWLKQSPRCLKTFVSNRVAQIQDLTTVDQWRHVATKDNPADILSRGVTPRKMQALHAWWAGPNWLSQNESNWPKLKVTIAELPEKRERVFTFVLTEKQRFQFENYSNLSRLKRIIAYIFRFTHNCKHNSDRKIGPITVLEMNQAQNTLIKLSQGESFSLEINELNTKGEINPKSKILGLNPFLDKNGILRVGGRLKNSQFSYYKKYPIILSAKHYLTKFLFEETHRQLLHAGPQQLLASIHEQYWPLAGRNLAKATVHKCIRCFRFKPKTAELIMGNLPKQRVEPGVPFETTGTDYAGPFLLKDKKGRGAKFIKCYICLFVCFTTKAIHLELVSSLTTECFIAALRRFVSRRGKPKLIFSDNGTNYVGANTELEKLSKFLLDSNDQIIEQLASEKIEWRFIPPQTPHFGGLWEAGVKSIKYHLRRVLGDVHLVYEDFYTILVQIEAILNSRPLTPLSSHPDDLNPITPAHFLVGRSLTEVIDADYEDVPVNRLSLYQHLQMLKQHFWTRWSREYISQLQERTKWKKTQHELQPNALVLIKDDNLPPMKWKLGRIIETHPGRDGVSRVASIRTQGGIIRRPFSKICPLPVESAATFVERQPFQGGGHVQECNSV